MIDFNTIQQLIRILMGWGGSALVSMGLLNADMATVLTGAVVALAQVVWWVVWERTRVAPPPAA